MSALLVSVGAMGSALEPLPLSLLECVFFCVVVWLSGFLEAALLCTDWQTFPAPVLHAYDPKVKAVPRGKTGRGSAWVRAETILVG